MGKTLTITDDELGATASVRIEQEHGQPVIRSLHFDAAEGRGLSSAALALMEDLGLTLPSQAPQLRPARKNAVVKKAAARKSTPARRSAAPAPPRRPAAASPPAAPARQLPEVLRSPAPALPAAPAFVAPTDAPTDAPPPATSPAAAPRQRRTGPPPSVSQLRDRFTAHGGDLTAMAAEFGCSVSTVSNWLRRAREGGAQITAGTRP